MNNEPAADRPRFEDRHPRLNAWLEALGPVTSTMVAGIAIILLFLMVPILHALSRLHYIYSRVRRMIFGGGSP